MKAKTAKTKTPRPTLAIGSTILCLDVSSKAAGVALMQVTDGTPKLLEFALFTPVASWPLFRRIDALANRIGEYTRKYSIDLAVMEFTDGVKWMSKERGPGWSKFVVALASAQSAVREAIRPYCGSIETVAASEWTRRVPKETRATLIRSAYRQYAAMAATGGDKGLDVADAIGIGIWRCGL